MIDEQTLKNIDAIAIIWTTEDVLDVAPHLDREQAREVLERVKRNHDASYGINWDTLRDSVDILTHRGTGE